MSNNIVTFVGCRVVDTVRKEDNSKLNYLALYYYFPKKGVTGCIAGALQVELGTDLSAKLQKMDYSEPLLGVPLYEFDGRYSNLVDIEFVDA